MPMGTVVYLTQKDTASQEISFYYKEAATNSVTINVSNNGGQMQSASIIVTAPTPNVTSSVTPNNISRYLHFENKKPVLGYYLDGNGDSAQNNPKVLAQGAYPGMSFIYGVSGSGASSQNTLFMTQTLMQCENDVNSFKSIGTLSFHSYSKPSLDTTAPYGLPSITSSAGSMLSVNDSPGFMPLDPPPSIIRIRQHDYFADYFMFQSGKQFSIPVTLATTSWELKIGLARAPLAPNATNITPLLIDTAYTLKPAAPRVVPNSALPEWTTVLGQPEYPISNQACTA